MEGHFLSAAGGPLRGPGLQSLLFVFSLRTHEFHNNTLFKTVKCLMPVVRVYTEAYLYVLGNTGLRRSQWTLEPFRAGTPGCRLPWAPEVEWAGQGREPGVCAAYGGLPPAGWSLAWPSLV